MSVDHHTYTVKWSVEDGEHVGLCAEFPSLSWLAKTPAEAIAGIRQVVAESGADMAGEGCTLHGPAAIRTDAEYEQAITIINAILDIIGDNEAHPLAEPLDMIANLVKAYEDVHVKIGEHLAKLKANKHIGSDFDNFLREAGIYGDVSETAMQRVRKWQAKE